jgi:predicted GIY-YIG superfamily endonuclease
MPVYLLHFNSKVADHAQHYVGYAEDVDARIEEHRRHPDARLMQVCKEREIDFQVARVWPDGDRTRERQIKNWKHASRYCPICRAANKGR